MTDPLNDSLRSLMTRQHARHQIEALMAEHGDDVVIYAALDIAERKRQRAYDAYVKERDAARAAFVNPITAGRT